MPNPTDAQNRFADALASLRELTEKRGLVAIRSRDMSDRHRRQLLDLGFIKRVMKGWYIPSRPDEWTGESTSWYVSFWSFCAQYLEYRFGPSWSLSPEQSLLCHAGNRTVPNQLVVRSPEAGNQTTTLPYETSLVEIRSPQASREEQTVLDELRLYTVEAALVRCTPSFYTTHPVDARTTLMTIPDASGILHYLLEEGKSVVAGRIAGAFRHAGRNRLADDILKTMSAAGFDIRESNPFDRDIGDHPQIQKFHASVARVRVMWESMRDEIRDQFPSPPGLPDDPESYLMRVEDEYQSDAYHSLSIEGYRVTAELIDRVRGGAWDPEMQFEDRQHRDAMAARGYWNAFQGVKKSIRSVLEGESPARVCDRDHGDWYREMFSPSVSAGILSASELAGYRRGQVFIQDSRHIPPASSEVRELMPLLFELLETETEPSVRAVLGHFMFGYIHPYMDGNGRMARFMMNVMLASGGYPWTIIPVSKRGFYMKALEEASTTHSIRSFAALLSHFVSEGMDGRTVEEM